MIPKSGIRFSQKIGVHPKNETRIKGTVLEERTDVQTEIACLQAGGAAPDLCRAGGGLAV
jgi:hypothetical protein